MINLDLKFLEQYIEKNEMSEYQKFVSAVHEDIENGTGSGSDFLGWNNLNELFNKEEISNIKETAVKIQKDSEVLLVIGIGGSYLGARAVIDLIGNSFYNQTAKANGLPEIYFVGNNISSTYMSDLEELIKGKDFSINVISKSGTTLEPAIAFRHFRNLLVEKYGNEANQRIYATTDAKSGALHNQAIKNNWESFIIPDSVGGRFSVMTPVGLLPIAVSGIDIDELIEGFSNGKKIYSDKKLENNDAYKYAVARNILYTKGKNIEILSAYEEKIRYFTEWWKQLFGESEGKDQKGIYPTSAIYSTDLHSLGQFVQDGKRDLFETILLVKNVEKDIKILEADTDEDQLNYLAGKNVSYVNHQAAKAVIDAHVAGGVPNIVMEIEKLDAKNVGELLYFFEKACAMSAYLLGVNPFNQPGVEAYKNRMFELLEKPNYGKGE